MLYLVSNFLRDRNMHSTVEALEKETKYDLSHGARSGTTKAAPPLQRLFDDFHEQRLKEALTTSSSGLSDLQKRRDDEEVLRKWHEKRDPTLVKDGEEDEEPKIPNTLKATLVDLHSQNPLSVRFNADQYPPLVATGGADRLVTLADSETGDMIGSYTHHKAGVLSLDFHPRHPSLLLTGSMDATHAVVDTSKDGAEAVIGSWKEHSKFVVKVLCKHFFPCRSKKKTKQKLSLRNHSMI